jgi:hypothetical protein
MGFGKTETKKIPGLKGMGNSSLDGGITLQIIALGPFQLKFENM